LTEDEKKQRATEFLRVCETGQVEKAIAWITDDYYFESMKRANPPGEEGKPLQNIVDRETFIAYVPTVVGRTQNGLNLNVDLAMADGDDVALFGTSNAVTLKDKVYSNAYCWFFHFRGDKIAFFREYCDFHLVHTVLRA
jgi:ketosteroid isomerase-like protein